MSFFTAIKGDLGIPAGLTSYDNELMQIINKHLSELGVEGLQISDVNSDDVQDKLNEKLISYEGYRYVLSAVKLELEPPTSPIALEYAQNDVINLKNQVNQALREYEENQTTE